MSARSTSWVVLAFSSAAIAGCGGAEPAPEEHPPEVTEGYVAAEDGVRLWYRSIDDGPDVVVIPVGFYLADALAPLADGRRLVFYDPRNRGRSEAADLSTVSLDRQVRDLEAVRAGLGIERMALIGWSGLGMEVVAYAIRHPERVTRIVQMAAVPPAEEIMAAEGDADAEWEAAIDSLVARWDAGEFGDAQDAFCRAYNALALPPDFVDTTLVAQVPDTCVHENEWPANLWPYFGALLGSFAGYDWRPRLESLGIPRLVIHGREDRIPFAGAVAWVAGYPDASLIELSPAGHFPFLEQRALVMRAIDEFLDGAWPAEAKPVPGRNLARP